MSNKFDKTHVENTFLSSRRGAQIDLGCGGAAYRTLLQDTRSIIVAAYSNDPNKLSWYTLNCPYVLGVAGYDIHASTPDYIGHAPIAGSHDFYTTASVAEGEKGTRISETPRSVSVPFDRLMHDYRGTDPTIALINPRNWPFGIVLGNSFSTPLVAGLVAEIMAYWPGGPNALTIQKIYDLLNYGSWRRAYPHNGNGQPFQGIDYKDAPAHSDPIVNYPCVMASVLLANLNHQGSAENQLGIFDIYRQLGPAKTFSIFGGLECDPPYQNIDPKYGTTFTVR